MEEGPVNDPPDDPSILDGEKVLRRIVPGRFSRRTGLPEDGTFKKDGLASGTSVTLWRSDEDLAIICEGHLGFGVVGIYVSELRLAGLAIAFVDEPGNPNHCEIFGPRTGTLRKKLTAKAPWVEFPDEYPEQFRVKPLWTREAP